MTTWTSNELNKIGKAEELQIALLRRDDALRNPVTIWVVPVGDDSSHAARDGRRRTSEQRQAFPSQEHWLEH